MPDRVALTVSDGVAELRLTRPEAHNAIDWDVVTGVLAGAHAVRDDPSVRALLISAAGPSFSVGGDLAYLAGVGDRLGAELRRMIEPYHEALATLDELRVPVVTVVQGPAAGGGLGLLYVADLVLVAPDARLVAGFDKLGLSGDGGGTFHLPRLVGLARAQLLQTHGRVVGAEEAVAWGLAARVVDGDLREAGLAEARRMAAGSLDAYAEQRGLLRRPPAREHLERETGAMERLGATAFAQQRVQEFAARRA